MTQTTKNVLMVGAGIGVGLVVANYLTDGEVLEVIKDKTGLGNKELPSALDASEIVEAL